MKTILRSVLLGSLFLVATLGVYAISTQNQSSNDHTSDGAILISDVSKSGVRTFDTRKQTNINERFLRLKEAQRQKLAVAALEGSEFPLKAATPVNVDDSLALVDLYNATNGPSWANTTKKWLVPGSRVADWHGVTVSGNRVISLAIPSNSLNGTIPASIGNLSLLNFLDFSGNSLHGSLPDFFSGLVNLEYLNLSDNQFTGSFPPSVGNLTTLFELYISNNLFSGNFPSEISSISNLYYFDISSNNFTGNVLNNIIGHVNLMSINIGNNSFTGDLPPEIGGFSALGEFYINNNNFTFKNIEVIFDWNNWGAFAFNYSNQDFVGVTETIEKYLGETIHISIKGYEASSNDAFRWHKNGSLISGENDSIIHINSAVRNNAGEYYCEVTNSVLSGLTLTSNVVTVDVLNHIPVANAGPDQDVDENTLVTLDASASSDGDNDPLTYQWTAPIGFFLSSEKAQKPTFTAPDIMTDSTFIFTVVVNDGLDNSLPDTVLITIRQINKIPVANAGADQTVDEQTLVNLDGRSSSDGDPHPLTFSWTSPEGITLSSDTDSHPTFTAPNVTKDTSYTFVLVVYDGFDHSAPDTMLVNVSLVNVPPVADAGMEQTVNENTVVTLDASASSDADGHPITYHWTPPAGITLSSNTDVAPTFMAPEVSKDTTYQFILVVNDGYDNSIQDTAVVNVLQVNRRPVANAGVDQFDNREGDQVSLDATASSDFDGDPLTYNWSAPAELILNDSTSSNPVFTVPNVNVDTTFHIILVVSDGIDTSAPDTVAIAVINNLIPVANAGTDQTVEEGELVHLTASASSDGNSDPLTYSWSAPAGIVLSDGAVVNPTFTAPDVQNDTIFSIALTVNDGFEDSESDTVRITVKNKAASVPETLALTNVTLTSGQSQCYDAVQTITVAGSSTTVVLQTGSAADFIAGQRINFLPGFHAQSGSRMHAYISSVFCDPAPSIVQADTKEKGVVIGSNPVKPEQNGVGKSIKVYPNPTTGRVVVELVNYVNPATISVYNMKGSKITAVNSVFTSEFSLASLEKGLYIIQVTGDNTVQTQKVLLQ